MHIANSQILADVNTFLKCDQLLKRYGQLPNYSLLTIMSFTVSKNDPFAATLVLLWQDVLPLVKKHFSILNDFSLWADNWRDSVNCGKLKVLSNYTDSHRRVKVSLPLWSHADDEMASNYRNQTPNEGNKLPGPPPHPRISLVFCGCRGTCFIIIGQLIFWACVYARFITSLILETEENCPKINHW